MKIEDIEIPDNLKQLLTKIGYIDLYPPQESAIKTGLLNGKNVLLSTPTASGKTLVAIIASGKIIIENNKKVVYLTPLRALANEKYNEFKELETLNKKNGEKIKVGISTGDYNSAGDILGRNDVIILTNEKFDSLIRHETEWIEEVGLFVIDEIHLLNEPYRGPTLEMILTKIMNYMNSQIIALSATINNTKEIAKWLNAEIVDNKWRPVKLVEGVYNYGKIKFNDGTSKSIVTSGKSEIIDIAFQSVLDGGQTLTFVNTRFRANSVARKISETSHVLLNNIEKRNCQDISRKIMNSTEETELSRNLARMVINGVAFHHAGLHSTHRQIIEDGFRNGNLKILTTTPTLASGVNLPARLVIIADHMRYNYDIGRIPISIMDYKQMCGRAGRPKFDSIGETVLISKSTLEAEELYNHYIEGEPESIESQLDNINTLQNQILSIIVSIPGISQDSLKSLFSKTFLALKIDRYELETKILEAIRFLSQYELVEVHGDNLIPTEFGKKISILYIEPKTGIIFREVMKNIRKINTIGLIHLIVNTPDYRPKFNIKKKDENMVTNFIELNRNKFLLPISYERKSEYEESYIEFKSASELEYNENDQVYQEFKSALVLYSWINEMSEDRIMKEYGTDPGDLHRSRESAEWLLYSFSEITKLFGKVEEIQKINEVKQRMKYGIKSELLPLTKLKLIGRIRARELYKHGFTDINKINRSAYKKLSNIPKIGKKIADSIINETKYY